ncbi:sensor histidine kinase [Dactylosporangium sp. CA-139066]|uniref:sensor histidine kinase n=1 Tax=Dactylosporangium sp. CA-139066 TaxID=3239930 RepID=UPI003D8E68B1
MNQVEQANATAATNDGLHNGGTPAPASVIPRLVDELQPGKRPATDQDAIQQLAVLIARCVPADEAMAVVASATAALLDADAAQLLQFAAVIDAESRTQLNASRARIVLAADEARRGFERDLHDSVQQRLVSLGLELRTLEALVGDDRSELKPRIGRTIDGLTRAYEDLQEISRRLHPAILTQGGLSSALKALARRSPVPVTVDVRCERRFCSSVETAAYHVVSEALTLVAEHAQASAVTVDVDVNPATATTREMLALSIHAHGTGGDDAALDSRLVGLVDRVEALGGHLRLAGPPPGRTPLLVTLPADGRPLPG